MLIRCTFCGGLINVSPVTKDFSNCPFIVKMMKWNGVHPVFKLFHKICWEMQEGKAQTPKLLPPPEGKQ